MNDRIVSIGLLTQHDLRLLGEGFTRHFPVENDDAFKDILAKLDAVAREESKPDDKKPK